MSFISFGRKANQNKVLWISFDLIFWSRLAQLAAICVILT